MDTMDGAALGWTGARRGVGMGWEGGGDASDSEACAGAGWVRNVTIEGYSRTEDQLACDDIHVRPEVAVDGLTLRDCHVVNRTPEPLVFLNNRGTLRNLVMDGVTQRAENPPARGALVRNTGKIDGVRTAGLGGENLAVQVDGM